MTLAIKNWTKFQHFKDRTPPWVKLYRELLDDPDWHDLDGDSAKLLVNLWLVASEDDTKNGLLPDPRKLAFRLRMSQAELNQGLAKLEHWLIQVNISVISDQYQDDAPETETETETETEGEAEAEAGLPCPQPARQKPSTPDCPHEEIIRLWAEQLPSAIQPKAWAGKRAEVLRSRWREDKERQSLEWWRDFFAYVAKSDFLMGRTSGNRAPFQLSLDWLCKSENFLKVIEGRYDNRDGSYGPSLFAGGI